MKCPHCSQDIATTLVLSEAARIHRRRATPRAIGTDRARELAAQRTYPVLLRDRSGRLPDGVGYTADSICRRMFGRQARLLLRDPDHAPGEGEILTVVDATGRVLGEVCVHRS